MILNKEIVAGQTATKSFTKVSNLIYVNTHCLLELLKPGINYQIK